MKVAHLVAVGSLAVASLLTVNPASAATGYRVVSGEIPAAVTTGHATLVGPVAASQNVVLNVALQVRDSAGLDRLIQAAATPGSPSYGHYLTPAEYMAQYAPTADSVQSTQSWLAAQGLSLRSVAPNNLQIEVSGSASQVESAFSVGLNTYQQGDRTFFANDRDPSVPANLPVRWVSGLTNYYVGKIAGTVRPGGYFPQDFQSAYDMGASPSGKGQSIGYTLWHAPLQQSDLNAYAANTGTTGLIIGGTGQDGIQFIPVDGTSTQTDAWAETAMDVEVSHGMAPGSHLKYWLGATNSFTPDLEDAVTDAANDTSVTAISNSWDCSCGQNFTDPTLENQFQYAAGIGKTFYFATGDSGNDSGTPNYPAYSPYVVAVGGTTLNLNLVNNTYQYVSESAWSGSGGGCASGITRPGWQVGVGTPLTGSPSAPCTGRAEPDVSADADPNTGAYVYFSGAASQYGGTSLATPIWAALETVWNHNDVAAGRPTVGFAAPLIYSLANDPTTYANDFHDVTQGSNGYSAGTGWDEVTGWGSVDFSKVSNNAAQITLSGPTSGSPGQQITEQATLVDNGATTPVVGRTVTISVGAEQCSGATNSSGVFSCNLTPTDPAGAYTLTASFAGDAAYTAASTSEPFNLNGTTVALTSSSNPAVPGTPITFTATVTGQGTGTPTGTVTFKNGSSALDCGPQSLDSNGQAQCTTSSLGVGQYTITASYGGDTTFTPGISGPLTQDVGSVTTTSLQSSVDPSAFNQPVTFTATVAGTGTPTGTVEFKDGTSDISNCSSQSISTVSGAQVATCTTSTLAIGGHSITAIYSGDGSNIPSTSSVLTQTVGQANVSYTLGSSLSPSTYGQSVTLSVTVASQTAGTPTGTVNFQVGGSGINGCGNVALNGSGQATCTTSALPAGSLTITVLYSGDTNFLGGTSNGLSQIVNQAQPTMTIASSVNPSAQWQTVTFTAQVSLPYGGTPGGTTTFSDGGRAITGCATVNGSSTGTFTCSTSTLSSGSHTITATYNGDNNTLTSQAQLTQTVGKLSSTTTLTSSANPAKYRSTVTFTAAVTGSGATPTGSVVFTADGKTICNATLSSGKAKCSTSSLAKGQHTIGANYQGNTTYNPSGTTLVETIQ